MKDKYRNHIYWGVTAVCVITASLIIAFLINKFGQVQLWYNTVMGILTPVLYGAVLAFLTAPIYNRVYDWLKSKISDNSKNKKFYRSMSRGIATTVCLFILIAVVTALIWMLIPQLVKSIMAVVNTLPSSFQNMYIWLEKTLADNPEIESTVLSNYADFTNRATNWLSSEFMPNLNTYIAGLSSGVLSVVTVIKNIAIGLIVMVYLLNLKATLAAQSKKIVYSLFNLKWGNIIVEECRYVKQVFSKFIVGKLIDSFIIGILCFIVFSIIGLPYALLVSVIVGVTNIIPFFGPFIGAIPCAFLLLLVSPISCLQFVICIIIIQQIDGNIIGPKIIGQTTGLSSFWILFSILLFGGLFGIVGMIIGVPTFAVIYRIITQNVNSSLQKKKLSSDTMDYRELDHIDATTGIYVKTDDEK